MCDALLTSLLEPAGWLLEIQLMQGSDVELQSIFEQKVCAVRAIISLAGAI